MEDHGQFLRVGRTPDGVLTVLLHNPPLNILTRAVRQELLALLTSVARDPTVRVLVLSGTGERAFSVGSDIREFAADMEPERARARAAFEHRVVNALEALPVPTIAAIEGYALGGGLELALGCDLRIAGESAILGFPEVDLGVFPGGGGTERLPRLVGPALAKELCFTGRRLTAAEARDLRLINTVVPTGTALAAAQDLAATLARKPPLALQAVKVLVDRAWRQMVEAALPEVAEWTARVFTSADAREGVAAFLAKRPPRFGGERPVQPGEAGPEGH